jgi:hypothetical protein
VAVLLAQIEGYANQSAQTINYRRGTELVETLERMIFEGIDASLELPLTQTGKQVRLVPTLFLDSRGLCIILSVGTKNLYMIKSTAQFIESCRRGETVSYGAGLEFTHRRAAFDAKGQRLLDFVRGEETLYAEMGKLLAKQFNTVKRAGVAAREVPVTTRNIDDFYDLYEGETLKGEGDFAAEVELTGGKPPLLISLSYDEGGTSFRADYPSFRLMEGRKYFYVITESKFLRLPLADGAFIAGLYRAVSDAPEGTVWFEGQDEQRFLTVILPKLKQLDLVGAVNGTPRLLAVEPPEINVFFEPEGAGILARTEFIYKSEPKNATRDYVAEYTLQRSLVAGGFSETEEKALYRLRGDDEVYDFLFNINGVLDKCKCVHK